METGESQAQAHTSGIVPSGDFVRKRYLTSWLFGLGILLFLLPFSEIKCSSTTLAENSGLGIALGWQWKVAMVGKNSEWLDKLTKDASSETKNKLKEKPNVFALVALVAGIAGLLFSFLKNQNRSLFTMSAGILAVLMLVALMIQFKLVLQSSLSDAGSKNDFMNSIIRVQFTFWYYFSLLLFGGTVFVSFRQHKLQLQDALKKAYDFEFEKQQHLS